jgi:hypothetical protein
MYYFGPWADPVGAFERWLAAKDDLLAGRISVLSVLLEHPDGSKIGAGEVVLLNHLPGVLKVQASGGTPHAAIRLRSRLGLLPRAS